MNCVTTQEFGKNANPAYKSRGLDGHTGRDYVCGWHAPVRPRRRIFVYKVLDGVTQTAYDGTGFTGVFGIDEYGNEWLYGHLDTAGPAAKMEGRWYGPDNIIGYEANHGTVYSGGVRITLEMQKAGDTRGHHVHEQKRPCRKVQRTTPGQQYLTSYIGGYYRDSEGYYYEFKNPGNGFNGCVDPNTPEPIQDAPLSLSDEIAIIAARRQANEDSDASLAWAISKALRSFGK